MQITNQSFEAAGGAEVFPDLEIGGIVITTTYNQNKTIQQLLDKAHKDLTKIAKEKGYSHIFALELSSYTPLRKHPSYGRDYKVMGTGYKKRKKK